MQKIVSILIIGVLITGCSVTKRQIRKSGNISKPAEIANIYQNIINQNITAHSFNIEKAEFKIESDGGENSGIVTIKFLRPDKFLISIKSNLGFEIARLYLTGDSIFVNDRLGKKLYYGSTSYLKQKYGLTTSILPVILGDYVNDDKIEGKVPDCKNGKIDINAIIKDVRINYIFDCIYGKSIVAVPEKDWNAIGLKIQYSEFFRENNINIPGMIEISEQQNNTKVEIRIKKITTPWEGTIEFIPGKQYEKIHLL